MRRTKTVIKDVKLTKIEKAMLEILIHEIRELKPNRRIEELLDTWVKENGLHPENVETVSVKKMRR